MIFWQGWGILSLVIPALTYMGIVKMVQVGTSVAYTDTHSWPGAVGTLVGAAVVWYLGISLRGGDRTLLDPKTGQTIILRKRNSIFFVPMEYAGIILGVVALGMLIFKSGSPL